MPKPKDCGCGGGKNCITKAKKKTTGKGQPEGILDSPAYKEAMALYYQSQDPAVLAELKKVVLREEKKMTGKGQAPAVGQGGCDSCGGSLKVCPPGYENIGLLCSKYIPIDTSRLPWTGGYFETIERIDHGKVQNEVKQAFEKAFSKEELERTFDPERNGVADSFRKFGADSEEAFKDLGRKMEKAFDPNQNGVRQGFEKMRDAFPNDDWWKATMSDPDTWITLVGTIAGVAAMVLSGGTAGPLVIAALGALGPSMTIIGAVARGKPIDPLDIAALTLAIIPGVGAAGSLDDAIKAAAQTGKAAQTATLGKVLATASTVAGKVSTAVRTGVAANANTIKTVLNLASKVVRGAPGQIAALFKGKPLGAVLTKLKPGFFQLPAAQKLDVLRGMGVRVYKEMTPANAITAAKQAVAYAKRNGINLGWAAYYGAAIAEGTGAVNIPDIETKLIADGFGVALESIQDWNNPPEGYDYVLPVVETDDPEEQAALNYEMSQKRQAEESAQWRAGESGREAIRQTQEEWWASHGEAGPTDEQIEAYNASVRQEERMGSGMRHKNSLVELNMSGAGYEDAYIGIDMSRLVGGSGDPSGGTGARSYEGMYEQSARENTMMKMAAVRRRAAERTVKIQPYSQRPELLSDTFKVAQGRDIHGAGGAKPRIKKGLPSELKTTAKKASTAVGRFLKAAIRTEKGLKGGDWFNAKTWTWDSVNPVNWTTEDWTNLAKGADAAIFGTLSDPKVLAAAVVALKTGAGFTFPPPVGFVAGATLAMALTGAVMAHEYVYPSCADGVGALGCNEYRGEVKKVVEKAVEVAQSKQGNDALDRVSEYLTSGVGENMGDLLGEGAYRGAFTRGEPQTGEEEVKFYYPASSEREMRGVATAGGEYAGPSTTLGQMAPLTVGSGQTASRHAREALHDKPIMKAVKYVVDFGVGVLVSAKMKALFPDDEDFQRFVAALAGYTTDRLADKFLARLREKYPSLAEEVQVEARNVAEHGAGR